MNEEENVDDTPTMGRTQPSPSVITLHGDGLQDGGQSRLFQVKEEDSEDENAEMPDSRFGRYRPTVKEKDKKSSSTAAAEESQIRSIASGEEDLQHQDRESGNSNLKSMEMMMIPMDRTVLGPRPILKSASVIDESIEQSTSNPTIPDTIGHDNHNDELLKEKLMNNELSRKITKLLSIIYAMLVVIIGAMFTIGDMSSVTNDHDHLYNIITTLIGLIFLLFLHIDVQRHKRFLLRFQKKHKERIEEPLRNFDGKIECDSVSVVTTVIFNRIYNDSTIETINDGNNEEKSLNRYRFLTGKHSGSFYLKIGMTLFCMGSIVHQGINLIFQIHYFTVGADECKNLISLLVYLLHCISAFYQLYIAFKYSNLVINANIFLVRFGLMHMVGCSISSWFSTIMEEAIHGYMEKIHMEHLNETADIFLAKTYRHHLLCQNKTLADFESIDALPYFYPFSIEFNIIIASVWYIIWTNVENKDWSHSKLGYVREELNEDRLTGKSEITYQSNLSINADCHASNLGMFGGFASLLFTIISILIFFTTIKHNQYKTIGIAVYTAQITFLTLCLTISIPLAYYRTRMLNVVHHLDSPINSMDDFLLLAPLPFYYIHHLLCIYSEINQCTVNSILMAIGYGMNLIQVTCQTLFIIDGTRRCSNKNKLRKNKPGKELITFSIIINVTLWILITFEIKSVDKYHSMPDLFGKFVWMVILDTCLPLILFYRFHSSVCLSQMWAYCYEKDQH